MLEAVLEPVTLVFEALKRSLEDLSEELTERRRVTTRERRRS